MQSCSNFKNVQIWKLFKPKKCSKKCSNLKNFKIENCATLKNVQILKILKTIKMFICKKCSNVKNFKYQNFQTKNKKIKKEN
jgi:hypothetical protein